MVVSGCICSLKWRNVWWKFDFIIILHPMVRVFQKWNKITIQHIFVRMNSNSTNPSSHQVQTCTGDPLRYRPQHQNRHSALFFIVNSQMMSIIIFYYYCSYCPYFASAKNISSTLHITPFVLACRNATPTMASNCENWIRTVLSKNRRRQANAAPE